MIEVYEDYLSLFLNDVPLLDVRAPVEFREGAFPQSINLPLLDDEQRKAIGIRYKEAGKEAAIALGWEMASPQILESRLQAWSGFCHQHPEGLLYCWRGGLRSKTSQSLIKKAGFDLPLVKGGYKALRNFLLQQFDTCLAQLTCVLLSGPTGSGKTRLLHRLDHAIDLEGMAAHRGSAFGATLQEQPSQINWENSLYIQLLKHLHHRGISEPVIIEDEARLIGRIHVPFPMQDKMKIAPKIILTVPMEERVALIRQDYVEEGLKNYMMIYGEKGFTFFSDYILGNLDRIKKRLGGVRYQNLQQLFARALTMLQEDRDSSGFDAGIASLLTDYYDPMYEYMLTKRQGPILFEGNADAIVSWLENFKVNQSA